MLLTPIFLIVSVNDAIVQTRRAVVVLLSRWCRHPATAGFWLFRCNRLSGTRRLSTTAKWLARYRRCIRYRGLRYRGLVSESSDIFYRKGADHPSHCYECPPTN